ncbi:The BTB (BR-C, ttk and bab)/POZ (Pox virus and Zinc finger) domain [Ceratobasidium sp. AG-Ba]|nr:The BTB (BR-C, ttk and bab)/POZ (Pox virus and Zinc finger) domain [Ceratobasidium sp. AG-Ba]
MIVAASSSLAQFSYQPPPGGDITIKSADGTTFMVHSVLLGLASSVFADMISTATQQDAVELSDDAESISLMLRFIYPPSFLDELSFGLLEKSLRIAQKYDIKGIIDSVDCLIAFHPRGDGGLIRSDTVRTFCLASTYGLSNTRKAAIKALRPENFRFINSKDIKPIAETFPSAAAAIGLLGAHCIRTAKLLDVLLGDLARPYLPSVPLGEEIHAKPMMCNRCFTSHIWYSDEQGRRSYEPGWLIYWAVMAFGQLATRPYTDCATLFKVDSLDVIAAQPGVCQECINVTRRVDFESNAFRHWAVHIKTAVEKIFSDIEQLYGL